MIDDYDNENGAQIISAYIGVAIYICVASIIAAIIIGIGNGATWSLVAGAGVFFSAFIVLAGVWKERRHKHWRNEQHEQRRTLITKNDNYVNRITALRKDDEWQHKLDTQARRELLAAPATAPKRELVQTAPTRMALLDATSAQPPAPDPVDVPKRETLMIFAALLELQRQPTFANCLRLGMPNNTTEYKLAKDYLARAEWVTASEEGERTEWGEGICEPDVLKSNVERLRANAQRVGR